MVLTDSVTDKGRKGDKAGGVVAGEAGGRVLSAAPWLTTKPKFTFGEFGLGGEPGCRRQHAAVSASQLVHREALTSRSSTVCASRASSVTCLLWNA